MTRWKPRFLALIAMSSLLSSACEEKHTSTTSGTAGDAGVGADKYAAADPKLARALQAAASSAPSSDHGPPPDGVFPPGAADQRHPRTSPANVDLISAGSEPRVLLGARTDGGAEASDIARSKSYGPAFLEVMMQRGRNAFPSVDLALSVGPAKRDDGGADWLVGDVKRTELARSQPGQLPPGVEKEMATLTGSSARVRVTPDGRTGQDQSDLAKGAIPDLQPLAGMVGEALGLATVPCPSQAVGVGAQWIAEVRTSITGIDVIEYRAYQLKSIDLDRLHLTVNIKAYACSKNETFAGAPRDATVEQFDGEGKAELDLVRGEILARSATVNEHAVVFLRLAPESNPQGTQGQQPAGAIPIELQNQFAFARGDSLRAANRAQ